MDSHFVHDSAALAKATHGNPWLNNPKYFNKVEVSSTACMKMMLHCSSGVEKGMKRPGGKPLEVMGLLLGKVDASNPTSMIVMDVYPIPVEGFETRVVADDPNVINYMISLSENVSITRTERFMGWYHSHPFDVQQHDHCFMSTTDVGTQLSWQRMEDPHGNPWLAIVIDPLRSAVKGVPEFGAFRVFPPEYNAPANLTPDGKYVMDDATRVERWGSAWNRYYKMEINYFMSSLSSQVLNSIQKNYLWMNALSTSSTSNSEYRERLPERIQAIPQKLQGLGISTPSLGISTLTTSHGPDSENSSTSAVIPSSTTSVIASKNESGNTSNNNKDENILEKVTHIANDVCTEQCCAQITQISKLLLFSFAQTRMGKTAIEFKDDEIMKQG